MYGCRPGSAKRRCTVTSEGVQYLCLSPRLLDLPEFGLWLSVDFAADSFHFCADFFAEKIGRKDPPLGNPRHM